jgi:hypothetical protein
MFCFQNGCNKNYSNLTLIQPYILCSIYDTKTSRIPCPCSEVSGLFYSKYFSKISLYYNTSLSLIPQNFFPSNYISYYIFYLNCDVYVFHSIASYYIMKRNKSDKFSLIFSYFFLVLFVILIESLIKPMAPEFSFKF